jgi:hypothetical protein
VTTANAVIRTRPGRCPQHGEIEAQKEIPKLRFPFLLNLARRGLAAFKPYRCPECGAKA